VRGRLWLLFAYLALPFDLIPDFIPVIGYADDAIIVAAVLRSVVRRAGPDAVRRHWPGTPDGLAALWRAARLPGSAQEVGERSAGVDVMTRVCFKDEQVRGCHSEAGRASRHSRGSGQGDG
jgi:hypothetical protein